MTIGDTIIVTNAEFHPEMENGSVGTVRSIAADGKYTIFFSGSNREMFFFKKELQKYFHEGQKVKKISGKPFKSGLKIATVKSIKLNPQSPKSRLAAELAEDGTLVDTSQLTLS